MSHFEHTIDIDQNIPIIYHHDTITPEYNYPNWHNNLEILYIREGKGSVLCGSNNYDAVPGDIFVINSYDVHSVTTNTFLTSTCFIIDNYFCTANGLPVEKLDFTNHIQSKNVSLLCDRLSWALESSDDFYLTNVKVSLLNLILYLAKNYSQKESVIVRKKSSNQNIRLALGYMKAHYNQNISLDQLAHELNLSKFYFLREFKKVTGVTPVTYMNLLRCNEAKKLIKKDKYTIKEIAEKCGFLNYSYFSKTFKKYIGILPSEYAKKVK